VERLLASRAEGDRAAARARLKSMDITRLGRTTLRKLRERMNIVFQDPSNS